MGFLIRKAGVLGRDGNRGRPGSDPSDVSPLPKNVENFESISRQIDRLICSCQKRRHYSQGQFVPPIGRILNLGEGIDVCLNVLRAMKKKEASHANSGGKGDQA